MPDAPSSQRPKRRDDVRRVLRLHHDSMHTARSDVEWIVRFVRFHGMRSRQDLFPAAPKIEACLPDLAVHGHVAPTPQPPALKALVSLCTRVRNQALPGRIKAGRADQKINVLGVMTREDVAAVISLLDGTAPLVANLLTGAACASWTPSGSECRTSMSR